ncbi:MAG: polyhydroxyalkanoate depolymerase [Parvularculaceae bacterium]|nr:polyhydroxyalkanoate depolymerase [Parvularculaceae bacterium]
MLYSAYELGYAALTPARVAAGLSARFWRSALNPMADTWLGRTSAAAFDVFENATRRYPKPAWPLDETIVNGAPAPVTIETVLEKSFCGLLHFRRDEAALTKARGRREDPKVLIVAPLSGHYATLLRGTVEAMLPEHDVYITDWANARNVPLTAGRFDLNDYIDYLIAFLQHLGPGAHAMAVCQPGPALLAATALMAEDQDPCRPATITIMGSPIDARRSPTVPNLLAQERSFEWFERNMIFSVPAPYSGALRRVYPGFVQLYSFLSMNHDRHTNAHYDYYKNLVAGDGDSADKHRAFYDEYLSVLDLTEEFYLQTIREVFQEFSLAEGKFMHRGRRVKPEAITDVGLLTVEGENDDISGIGQTQAAHDLCANLPDRLKSDYIQPGVGHFGVFNGSRWRTEIQPRVAKFMRAHHYSASRDLRAAAE